MKTNKKDIKIDKKDIRETAGFVINKEEIGTELKRTELKLRQEELESNIQDRKERKKYADKIFWFLLSFMAITLTAVFISIYKFDKLSDTVLVTLLTTTSANVISIFAIVVRYLFKQKKP
jgi:hypothetical protein